MKLFISVTILMLTFAFSAVAQEGKGMGMGKVKPTELDKTAAIPVDSFLKRGAPITASMSVSLNKVIEDPTKFAGKTILVEGVVVRSCKTEGCWAEVAQDKDSKSVRVKMKDHSFFIPLQADGSWARVEGVIQVKTLSKAEVDHMINDDGAKFPSRNTDGSVTELSFEATGIELKRSAK